MSSYRLLLSKSLLALIVAIYCSGPSLCRRDP